MIIRALKLRLVTGKGDFGFKFAFSRNLTIIRGGNSSGKSTLFNSLLYGMGMEELIGGRGDRVLPYAVKDYFEYEGQRINVVASEVLLEIENSSGEIVTVRRAIRDEQRDAKLVEVFQGARLTGTQDLGAAIPTYLHDSGAAQKQEGFHRFLETFLGLQLPQVATTSGGEAKLYLQAVFAALAVEQKRGWTDYIANIPFYGIRDARSKVVEYLLGCSVFESSVLRNRLNTEAVVIDTAWNRLVDELQRVAADSGVVIESVPNKVNALFDPSLAQLRKQDGSTVTTLSEYVVGLRKEYESLQARAEGYSRTSSGDSLREMDKVGEELQRLAHLHERTTATLTLQKTSLRDYEDLLSEAKEDLDRNKTAAKLRGLGAQHSVELAEDRCPTCHQHVEDTLLMGTVTGPQMDLATNVAYLESQCRMLERQIAGLHDANRQIESTVADLALRVTAKHEELNALRGDVSSGATQSRAILRRQVQIEVEFEKLERLEGRAAKLLLELNDEAKKLAANQIARKALPRSYYSAGDEARIALFQKMFRANAGSFGYESAPIDEIEINRETLVPFLAQIELREIIVKAAPRADIKADSSASDFVRLIWSYLLALHQTSAHLTVAGNHPGVLLLDEPGQHSMAVDSQHALLQQLSAQPHLQSIVAASFDESESVFMQATDGVKYQLVDWSGKLIRPL